MYAHEPCVFISITPHLSIIPASLQSVSTIFTLLCVCTSTLCLHFYHTSSINNTCITSACKYSLYIVMCMYMNLVSSFQSHLIYQYTCITTAGKYSLYIVMCMYMNLVSSFQSHLIYQYTCITTACKYSLYIVMCMYMNIVSSFLSIKPASLQRVSTLFTLLCVYT